MLKKIFLLAFILFFTNACSIVNSRATATGLDRWRVETKVNGYTTSETAIVSWYYKAATLALSKGYAGFKSHINKGGLSLELPKPPDVERLNNSSRRLNNYDGYNIDLNIILIKKPLNNDLGHATKVDAQKVVNILEPWMNKKCSSVRTICLDAYKELYDYLQGID